MVKIQAGMVLIIMVLSSGALAFNFPVSDREWLQWPAYCQTRYIGTAVGNRSKYAQLPVGSRRNYMKWKKTLGPTFLHIHHYCAGITRIKRAKLAEKSKRKRVYETAVGDIMYTYRKSDSSFPLFSQMSAHLAQAYVGAGRPDQALLILNKAVALQPGKAPAYIQMANMRTKEGKHDEAIRLLKNALNLVEEQKSAIHAKLARIYMEIRNYSEAKNHTNSAYKEGYRLPGLRKKLNSMENRPADSAAQ